MSGKAAPGGSLVDLIVLNASWDGFLAYVQFIVWHVGTKEAGHAVKETIGRLILVELALFWNELDTCIPAQVWLTPVVHLSFLTKVISKQNVSYAESLDDGQMFNSASIAQKIIPAASLFSNLHAKWVS